MTASRILFVACAVVAFALDRVSKLYVDAHMEVGERIDVLGSALQLRYIRNHGIAFGLFSDKSALVVAGTVLVGALLFFFMLRVDPDDLLTIAGGGLITGGALGNLVDRVQYAYVIDFLRIPRWPTFNVADMAIVGGVTLVIIAQLIAIRAEQRAAKTNEDAS